MERENSKQILTALEATSDAENKQQPAATKDNGPVFNQHYQGSQVRMTPIPR